MKIEIQNGIQQRYHIQKIVTIPNPDFSPTAKQSQVINNIDQFIKALIPVDKYSDYFVLRLDTGAFDINHLRACRIAVHAYADVIEQFLPVLCAELKNKYPLL